MLTHVAEELLAGNVARVDKDIPPKYFYFHLFGSLNVLHRREESLARLVLLEIARNTSFEYPWLKERRLLDAEGLCKLCNKREVRKAIKTLCTEMILDKDTDSREPRYRIRIPLVASALKQDANELESDALAELDET